MRTFPARRSLAGDRRGLVYVEFLLVFPPLFFLFLCILQLSFLYTGHLGVRHASVQAARAAIVIFPDDPVFYEEAPKNLIMPKKGCKKTAAARLFEILKTIGFVKKSYPIEDPDCWGGPRVADVRAAAAYSMLPFGPKLDSVLPDWVPVPDLGAAGWVVGSALYSVAATAVTFPTAPEAKTLLGPGATVGASGSITVRVTYLQHCGIPLARFFLCDTFKSLVSGFDFDMQRRRDLREQLWAMKRLRDSSPGVAELFSGSAHPSWLMALLGSDARFRVLRAETTLPMHSAGYEYQSEKAPKSKTNGGTPP